MQAHRTLEKAKAIRGVGHLLFADWRERWRHRRQHCPEHHDHSIRCHTMTASAAPIGASGWIIGLRHPVRETESAHLLQHREA